MTEFRRLLSTARTEEARALVRAGIADTPGVHALARTAAHLGVGSGYVTPGAHLTMGTAAKVSGLTHAIAGKVVKWLVLGLLGGTVASAVAISLEPPGPQRPLERAPLISTMSPGLPQPSVASPLTTPRPKQVESEAVENAAPRRASESIPTRADGGRVAAPLLGASEGAASTETLRDLSRLKWEVVQIDAARGALSADDARTAHDLLLQYFAHQRTGTLDREARILRVEALVKLREGARARDLASAFLRDFPDDAHAGALRALLDGKEH